MTSYARRLNLGCGSRYHEGWVNLDIVSSDSRVQTADLRFGIPYPDKTFDVVYHSHLLEHLRRDEALRLMKECWRVLQVGGTVRVAIPDLEQIARGYLVALEKAYVDENQEQPDYDWMMLELYDQTIRESSGGGMLEYLRQAPIPNVDFVLARIGGEGRAILASATLDRQTVGTPKRRRSWARIIRQFPKYGRNLLARAVLSAEQQRALRIGQFRSAGEVHQWMYDAYSMARILIRSGFQNPMRLAADQSVIAGWAAFNLDTEPDGNVYKPDSLYMEAVKPEPDGSESGVLRHGSS